MHQWESQSHVKWECKYQYQIIFVPKCRKRKIYGQLRKEVGPILRELFRQKGAEVVQGFAMPDHIHVLVSIPPKLSISSLVGYVKGRVRFKSIEDFWGGREISRAAIFGAAAIVSARSD